MSRSKHQVAQNGSLQRYSSKITQKEKNYNYLHKQSLYLKEFQLTSTLICYVQNASIWH